MHTHYPALMKLARLSVVLPHSTWNQDTGRLRWMRRINLWLHSQWGCWALMSVKGCLLDSPMPIAIFQGLMETCLRDLNLHWCIIFLEDIVISKDLASHLKRLEAVFWKLEKEGLKLKPSKCKLFWQQIAYLGHVISAQGVATDEGKIDAIKNWPTPTNITEVQSFLGFTGYYHWYIPKFAQIAQPLHEWMQARKRLPSSGTASVNRPLTNEETLYHCTCSCICRFHQTIQASHWCL